MKVVYRYVALQVPASILAAVILYALHRWLGLPLWIAGLLLAADVAKDVILYPYLKRAYQTREHTGVERLVGEVAEVCEPLRPAGYVRLRGELWKARLRDRDSVLNPGTAVRVDGAKGLVLEVSALSGDAPE